MSVKLVPRSDSTVSSQNRPVVFTLKAYCVNEIYWWGFRKKGTREADSLL